MVEWPHPRTPQAAAISCLHIYEDGPPPGFESQAIANFRRCSSLLTSRHMRETLYYAIEGVATNSPAIRRSLPRSRQPASHVAGEHSRRSAFTRSSFHASNTWLACTSPHFRSPARTVLRTESPLCQCKCVLARSRRVERAAQVRRAANGIRPRPRQRRADPISSTPNAWLRVCPCRPACSGRACGPEARC